MQAIFTKFFGPSHKPDGSTRGSRIKATASGGHSRTVQIDHSLSDEANHNAAAVALCVKLGWKGKLVSGSGPRGKGNVYVFLPKSPSDIITVK